MPTKPRTFMAAVLLMVLFSFNAEAANIKRNFQDLQLPTQSMLEHQSWATPIVATTNTIKTTYAGPTSAAAVHLTSFTLATPDYPRNITITPTGTTGDVESCVITITGTNIFNRVITEDLTFAADASTVQTGTKAFKTVTAVDWPADCESGGFAATWIIGVGSKLGMKRCAATAGQYVFSVFDSVYETTRGTVVADADEIEKNTFAPQGTMNGSKPVDLYFIQNYGCFP